MGYYRDTRAEINLDAIEWNVRQTIKFLQNSMHMFAVVKANAYGHGDVQVAKAALKAGANGLAVAFLDEALSLRKAGITAPILVLGASRPENAGIAASHNISLTVYDKEWLDHIQIESGQTLRVHIKCDTGMGRIGVKTVEELQSIIDELNGSPIYMFEGIFTHFATADEVDTAYFEQQLTTFQLLISSISEKPPYIHCANSAATLRFHGAGCNAVRLGISMYGLTPSPEIEPMLPFELKPAFSFHTKLIHVKQMKAGEKVSYGATYEASEGEWIGTIPVGYADGWIRKLSGQEVLIDGRRAPIVGRICMDQCMIRLPHEYSVGSEVTLIGSQGNEIVTMDEIAKKLDTINYEIPCIITARVPRVYREKGQIVNVTNPLL
ncbi:alanine racemase [Domibacillus epiphyticus]|uniref:Alanine racemase n=1 Tax=Domibacillus epiphyticus TaxID=1714355 RepID=A0A1V2A783_9BACI|nr:alanine racemase [Domibacillus epiphyticus]OMP66797.1 alanine racemase [Domibacillus epiphyticus]